METLYSVLAAIGIIAFGTIGIVYLDRKGILNKLDYVHMFMKISSILVHKYASEKTQDKFVIISSIVSDLVQYIEIIATYEDNEKKHKFAFDTTIKTLEKLGIQVDKDDEYLINTAIEMFVKMLPPTHKNE